MFFWNGSCTAAILRITTVITELLLWLKVSRTCPGLIYQINWLPRSLGCKKSAPVSSGPGGRHQQNAPVWTQHRWPTGVWNPDLTGDQELNNLVSHDSNFTSSPQILQITDSTAHHQIQSAHHKWSPVWVNNNYKWSCWFDLLWKFIWTFKQFLHTLVIVHFHWIQHLLLPLLEKLKN